MHYLDFSGERMLPSMPALLDQPFWLDPSDPHHMAAVMQVSSRPMGHNYAAASGDLAARPGLSRARLGARRSTASPPRASAPSRRSTRRSPASSRSWRSERAMQRLCHGCSSLPPCSLAGAARRAGRRPRGVVGEGVSTPRRTRRSRRSSPPSSRRPASRSTSSSMRRQELPDKIAAALAADQPPDFAFGLWLTPIFRNGPSRIGWWISRTPSATLRTCSIRISSTGPMLLNAKTGQKALYGLPMGQISNYIHVWKSLLEQRGVHARRHSQGVGARSGRSGATRSSPRCAGPLGRDDIWGIGLPMSVEASDTWTSSSSSSVPTMRTT